MFKHIILPILGVLVFIVVVGLLVRKSGSPGLANIFIPKPTGGPVKTITVSAAKIDVQIADTAEKRVAGLSGVTSLKENEGMLFVFDAKGVTPLFWMKGMLIPLDLIWIGDGKIVKIDKNIPIPPPGTPDVNLQTYSPGAPVDYVLEVNAGFSDRNSVNVEDDVDLSGI
ncbi:MAG: hypothetical protein UW20_C0011G0004 [Candidatus Woesebacteria bacterium GW2011_GWB1_44_11]|uniref:DUF192 domain-containing protein n=1 Tax=Candidatus Woesebacteria bacterium GW2011_GWB1_44_11 TaxID=1618579 RepID=A0A837I9G9_9BACT|nr:MAG: hypothetical protein UW20_C0011G0004 [Candidatus Woesebacteria bacterium GW2011_GWB1_44_11]OGM84931.1 MAG: hypothetical protein A2421_00225 [Candidatus Woesebacteria bacterium RIFOXYC1_FULL_43_18]